MSCVIFMSKLRSVIQLHVLICLERSQKAALHNTTGIKKWDYYSAGFECNQEHACSACARLWWSNLHPWTGSRDLGSQTKTNPLYKMSLRAFPLTLVSLAPLFRVSLIAHLSRRMCNHVFNQILTWHLLVFIVCELMRLTHSNLATTKLTHIKIRLNLSLHHFSNTYLVF